MIRVTGLLGPYTFEVSGDLASTVRREVLEIKTFLESTLEEDK